MNAISARVDLEGGETCEYVLDVAAGELLGLPVVNFESKTTEQAVGECCSHISCPLDNLARADKVSALLSENCALHVPDGVLAWLCQ